MPLYEYVYVVAVSRRDTHPGKHNLSSNRITSSILDFYVFENFDSFFLKHPGCDVKLIYALPPFCGKLANSADPDQTPHNQGGVGSGSPPLFARNLN